MTFVPMKAMRKSGIMSEIILFVIVETEKWAQVVKFAGIKPD